MKESIRTFIAVELPEDITASIHGLQTDMRGIGIQARWVPPANIHLTLKFLGDIEAGLKEKIDLEIKNTVKNFSPFKLKAKGIGVFPGIKRPRVIWAGISGQVDLLLDMQKKLILGLEHLGFPREKRSFKGHLTIGRFKDKIDPKKILTAINEFGGFESREFTVRNLTFFKSDLKKTGAEYSRLTCSAL